MLHADGGLLLEILFPLVLGALCLCLIATAETIDARKEAMRRSLSLTLGRVYTIA